MSSSDSERKMAEEGQGITLQEVGKIRRQGGWSWAEKENIEFMKMRREDNPGKGFSLQGYSQEKGMD